MGHTLVTAFSESGYETIADLSGKCGAVSLCRIPFGRDCDRFEANRVLKPHITLFHWPKKDDPKYLERLKSYRFENLFRMVVNNASLMHGEEHSLLLYLKAQPGEGFKEMKDSLEQTLGEKITTSLHITLGVSQDHHEIHSIYSRISSMDVFPFPIEVEGLDLYQIWKPVKLIKEYR